MYLTKNILRRTAKTQDNVEDNNANLCGSLNVFSVIGLWCRVLLQEVEVEEPDY